MFSSKVYPVEIRGHISIQTILKGILINKVGVGTDEVQRVDTDFRAGIEDHIVINVRYVSGATSKSVSIPDLCNHIVFKQPSSGAM